MSEAGLHNLEAEAAVLGAWQLRSEALDESQEIVAPEDFYRHGHQILARHMTTMRARREPIDLVTLSEALRASGELDAVGGPAYIAKLVDGVPRSTNAAFYAQIVHDYAIKRRVVETCHSLIVRAHEGDVTPETLLQEAEGRVFGIGQADRKQDLMPVSALVPDLLEHLQALYEQQPGATGIPTGFTRLDQFTLGLQRGDLVIVGARPSMGKTSFALDIARHVGLTLGMPVAFFSQEMSSRAVMLRLLIAQARFDGGDVRRGRLTEQDFTRLLKTVGDLEQSHIWIDPSNGLRPSEVLSKCRRLAAAKGRLGGIFVDYMQLMKGNRGERFENRNQEMTAISSGLKAIAKEMDAPMVALSQFSRKVEDRSDKRPTLADFRESGAIEQDADLALLIHRPGFYAKSDPTKQGYAEIDIAKARSGPIGIIKLAFLAEQTRFADLDEYADGYTEES